MHAPKQTCRVIALLAERNDSNFPLDTGQEGFEAATPSYADANQNREIDRVFEILDRTGDCGNEKTVKSDGKLADQCREFQDLDSTGRRRRQTA